MATFSRVRASALIMFLLAATASCDRARVESSGVVTPSVPADATPGEVPLQPELDVEEAPDVAIQAQPDTLGETALEADEPPLAAGVDQPPDADDEEAAPAPKGFSWTRETVGPLHYGMSAGEVVAALGEPESKTEPEEVPATGEFLAFWRYDKQGVSLSLAHQNESAASPAEVSKISVFGPSTFRTSRDVGLGSSFSSVVRAYKHAQDPDQDDDSIVYSDDRVVVGSIYGGLMFSFENERATSIFIGASAE